MNAIVAVCGFVSSWLLRFLGLSPPLMVSKCGTMRILGYSVSGTDTGEGVHHQNMDS